VYCVVVARFKCVYLQALKMHIFEMYLSTSYSEHPVSFLCILAVAIQLIVIKILYIVRYNI